MHLRLGQQYHFWRGYGGDMEALLATVSTPLSNGNARPAQQVDKSKGRPASTASREGHPVAPQIPSCDG